jgi:hypothetical protein
MRALLPALLGALMLTAAPHTAAAQLLNISPTTISFPSADPDTVPLVSAPPVQVSYTVVALPGQPWTISVRADGDLVSGPATIPISNVTWVATPNPPFRNGTLSTLAQPVANGTGPALLSNGNVTFRLANSWNYSVGTYTQSIVFTLSSP